MKPMKFEPINRRDPEKIFVVEMVDEPIGRGQVAALRPSRWAWLGRLRWLRRLGIIPKSRVVKASQPRDMPFGIVAQDAKPGEHVLIQVYGHTEVEVETPLQGRDIR